jgi:hypothetical protein
MYQIIIAQLLYLHSNSYTKLDQLVSLTKGIEISGFTIENFFHP